MYISPVGVNFETETKLVNALWMTLRVIYNRYFNRQISSATSCRLRFHIRAAPKRSSHMRVAQQRVESDRRYLSDIIIMQYTMLHCTLQQVVHKNPRHTESVKPTSPQTPNTGLAYRYGEANVLSR
jgi:hypothetical protein